MCIKQTVVIELLKEEKYLSLVHAHQVCNLARAKQVSVCVCVCPPLPHRLGLCDSVNCFPHHLYCFTLEIAKCYITNSEGLLCSRKLDVSKISESKIHRKDKTSHLQVFLNTAFFFSRHVWWFQRLALSVIQHHAIYRIRKGCPFFSDLW